MTDTALQLRETLLALGEDDRAWLAAELIASLDGPPDADAGEAWVAEIERRAAEVEAGSVELIDWSDASARLEKRLRKE